MEKDTLQNCKAYLIPHPIESFAKPILIESEPTYIGRSPEDGIQIQISDRRISRKHACIRSENGQFSIEDLGSQNGTFVNNERIAKTRLKSHDKISIGKLTYLFLLQSDPTCDPLTGRFIETSETIAISLEEIDLSDIWAQNADHAARGFLHQVADDPPESPSVDRLTPTRLSLLYQLSETLRTASNTKEVYEKGIELVMEAIPAAESALVAIRSVSDGSFNVVSCKWRDQGQTDGNTIPVSQTVFDWVLTEKVTLVSQNLIADQRFKDSESIRIHSLRSILCVPITGKNNVIGLLYAQANQLLDSFTKEDALFASAVANEMALNIDNMRLQKKMLSNERMAAIGLTASNLAHNIKNLLAVNQGAAELMDIHIKEKNYPQILKNWQWVQSSLADISKLSIDMLEYAKEDALYVKPVDINQLILTNRQSFEGSLSRKDLKFEYALTSKNPVWAMDKVQLQRALFNLILNAADAVKQGKKGRIKISTSVRQDSKFAHQCCR